MLDFIIAAIPWVVLGICIVIIISKVSQKQKVKREKSEPLNVTEEQTPKEGNGNYMAMGMSLGMCFGVMFSTTGLISLASGISFGMLIGMIIGMSMDKWLCRETIVENLQTLSSKIIWYFMQ